MPLVVVEECILGGGGREGKGTSMQLPVMAETLKSKSNRNCNVRAQTSYSLPQKAKLLSTEYSSMRLLQS